MSSFGSGVRERHYAAQFCKPALSPSQPKGLEHEKDAFHSLGTWTTSFLAAIGEVARCEAACRDTGAERSRSVCDLQECEHSFGSISAARNVLVLVIRVKRGRNGSLGIKKNRAPTKVNDLRWEPSLPIPKLRNVSVPEIVRRPRY